MTPAPPPSLFRFVQVRRPGPRAPAPPPPQDLPDGVFDFDDALLPTALDAIQGGDREAVAALSASLLGQMSPAANTVARTLRRMLRRVATNELITLGDLRAAGRDVTDADAFDDVVRRSVSVVVLERWLGLARSPNATRAFGLLRGAVVARLAASPLPDASRVTELIKGHSIVLPDPRITPAPAELPAPAPRRKRANASLALIEGDIDIEGDVEIEDLPPGLPTTPLPPPSLPVLDARARVLGRGDLMVVRIEHDRYELGEIAYVENVLKSELRDRTHVIDTATSETIIETADLFSETSQELTTTERFELEDAATSANTSTTSLSAGMTMSGGIGPVSVGIDLNADHTTTTSDSNSSSTSYAKEITDRATETLRSSSSSRVVTTNRTRITETNKHDFDNRAGADHIRGIYRWLNKVDRARVFNYGERLLLEFIVPEPASTHVYLAATVSSDGVPIAPAPLDFGPDDITESNFVAKGRRYDTAGLERPPAEQVTVPAEFVFAPAQPSEVIDADVPDVPLTRIKALQTAEVSIPDGYAAGTIITSVVYGTGVMNEDPIPGQQPLPDGVSDTFPAGAIPVSIAVGGRRFAIVLGDWEEAHVIELTERRTGALPVALGSEQGNGVAIAMRVVAYRTLDAYKAWQQRTFEAIQQAYLTKQAEYETAVSVAQIRDGYTAVTPSDVNRSIEVRELTRGCQTVLTDQDFSLFGSLELPPGEIPQIDVDEAWIEADVIQFFSDVFDWSLMAYLFYPYQWAGRLRWGELAARTSADPLHEAFLQAGAARVVVPVREGFEHAVARYLDEGVVPEWGPEPWRGRPSGFLPVDELIADANDRPGDEVAIGKPWEVVTPTTLIYLQQDAELNPESRPPEPEVTR
jgi:hypothetical protein